MKSFQDTEKNVSNKIISSMKNVMSDRHIVKKKIDSVFQHYRASLLLNVVENLDEMNDDIQSNFIKFNDFFVAFIS